MASTPISRRIPVAVLLLSFSLAACASAPQGVFVAAAAAPHSGEAEGDVCTAVAGGVDREQAELFRRAETERAEQLEREIERLQADLAQAESALVEVESGLTASTGRADAVSSLAVTRIRVERAASRAPWRAVEIAGARRKLEEAERQIDEERFGAALFFVYRARRVAEAVLDEVEDILGSGKARMITANRVNLRSGPSTGQRVLAVLSSGTPVIPQATDGEWTLVQVTGGPAGWIHRSLLGAHVSDGHVPTAPRP